MPQRTKDLNISSLEIDELIAQEAAKVRKEKLRPSDWTIGRLVEQEGITQDQARQLLKRLVKDGHLICVEVGNPKGGGTVHAYRLPE